MAVWIVRAGGSGEHEELALDKKVVVIAWPELGDLSKIKTRDDLKEFCFKTYPNEKPNTVLNWIAQLWNFRETIQKGELVVLPLKTRSAIAVGIVEGDYEYRPDYPEQAQHTRKVKWLRDDIPRNSFDQDLLYSFGAFLTVGRVRRNKAEERIRAVVEGKKPQVTQLQVEEETEEATIDLEVVARDYIMTYIGQKYKGHDFAELVGHVLRAQGYKTRVSPPGADGGVDIIAGKGQMGFDHPKLVVQVKSSSTQADVKVFRELQAVVKNFGAEQGLLVSWGGFTNSTRKEAERHFFEIRLWDSGDLIENLLKNYENLPDDIKAELPLKRIWTLVPEE